MDRLLIVSADDHVGGRPADYRDYLEAPYRDRVDDLVEEDAEYARLGRFVNQFPEHFDDIVDADAAIASGARDAGGWDVTTRLAEMDREGIAAQVLHSGHHGAVTPFFHVMNRHHPAELRAAGARAYHRWLADFMAAGQGRFVGVADSGPCLDLDATGAELRWVADHGFRSVGVPGYVHDPALPPLTDRYYEPYWAACEDLGLVLSVHVGWGSPQGLTAQFMGALAPVLDNPEVSDAERREAVCAFRQQAFELETVPDSPIAALTMAARRPLWQLMIGGVFDRHPGLKLVFTEVRADWVPATLTFLDGRFDAGEFPSARRPSEYFAEHCGMAASCTHRAEVELRHEIGLGALMFGVDFPHPESTWPNSLPWIRDAFAGVPEADARRILADNAIEWYSFDRPTLDAVAARVGPPVESVLTPTSTVDEALLETFDYRAAYRRPVEDVNFGLLGRSVAEDLAAAR